jgi:hypothetical protein
MSVQNIDLAVPAAVPSAPARREYLFNPVVDFLCLGGASLIALVLLSFVKPASAWQPQMALMAAIAANFINHPHFAHSYQIFYRDFRTKAFGDSYPLWLRRRYLFAGVLVPILLAGFFLVGILSGNPRVLGTGANVMTFFVGWHYVKQGYGMLMVDAALKRRFFDDKEKKILLGNAYACWIASWLGINWAIKDSDYWGLPNVAIPVPDLLFQAGIAVAFVTTGVMLYMLGRKTASGTRPPLNGTIAYLTSLYAWLLLARINPLYVLIIPAFHSLQYLLVVWRFQLNRERALSANAARPGRQMTMRLAAFAVIGLILGFVGFWFAPSLLNKVVAYDREVFGVAMFLFVFWIFINVHHYFLDSVMWRRENPDTKKYLFG